MHLQIRNRRKVKMSSSMKIWVGISRQNQHMIMRLEIKVGLTFLMQFQELCGLRMFLKTHIVQLNV